MSTKYPDLQNTLFPNAVDPLIVFKDVDINTKPYVDEYLEKYEAGDISGANKVIQDHPEIKQCMTNAYTFQTLQDQNIALQRTFSENILNLFSTIIKYQNEFQENKQYNLYDMFYYKGIPYMVASQDTPVGTIPPNTNYYVALAIKGESGTGLSFSESWLEETIYSELDCVPYDNRLWVSLQDNNVGNVPTESAEYWKSIITVPRQIIVSETQPEGQAVNDIWFKYDESGLTILEKTETGYRELLPSLTADNIEYSENMSIQDILEEHFSAQNPHNITPSKIGASPSNHTHDNRYYTETEIDDKLDKKIDETNGEAKSSFKITGTTPTLSLEIGPNNNGKVKSSGSKSELSIQSGTSGAIMRVDCSKAVQNMFNFVYASYVAGPVETSYMAYGTHNISMSESTTMPSNVEGCIHMTY